MSIDATRFVWKLSKSIICPLEKLLLLAIADRCGERGECWPSIARLVEDTLLSRDAIIRYRNKFIKQGILRFTGEMKGRSNQIPVMQLMVDAWREGDYIDNETDQSYPATGSHERLVPVAGKDWYQSLPATRNLKEEPKIESNNLLCGFDLFWNLYPSKKAKKKVQEIWKRRKLESIADEIIEKLKNQIANDAQWQRGYIPNPTTYLNQDRWNDDLSISKEVIEQKIKDEKKQANNKRLADQEALSKRQEQAERDRKSQFTHDSKSFRETLKQRNIPTGLKNLKDSIGIKDKK